MLQGFTCNEQCITEDMEKKNSKEPQNGDVIHTLQANIYFLLNYNKTNDLNVKGFQEK